MSFTTNTHAEGEGSSYIDCLSEFAWVRLEMWRRGELAGEEPPEAPARPECARLNQTSSIRQNVVNNLSLIRLRIADGIPDRDIANDIGISRQTVSKIRRGVWNGVNNESI